MRRVVHDSVWQVLSASAKVLHLVCSQIPLFSRAIWGVDKKMTVPPSKNVMNSFSLLFFSIFLLWREQFNNQAAMWCQTQMFTWCMWIVQFSTLWQQTSGLLSNPPNCFLSVHLAHDKKTVSNNFVELKSLKQACGAKKLK